MASVADVMERVEGLGIDYRLGRAIEEILGAHTAGLATLRQAHLSRAAAYIERTNGNAHHEPAESAAFVLDLPTPAPAPSAAPAPEKPFSKPKPFAGSKPGRKPALPAKTATPTPAALAAQRRCKACGTPKDPRAFKGGGDVCTVCQKAGKQPVASPAPAAKPANGVGGTNGAGKPEIEIPLTADHVQEYHSVSDVPHKRRALTAMERNNAPVCRLVGPNGAVVAVLHRADLDREFSEPDLEVGGDE
jgi:hypothetical protein